MYFKVTNKRSEAYKAISAFLKSISDTKKQNAKKLEKFTGIKFRKFSAWHSAFELSGKIGAIIPTDKNFVPDNHWIIDKRAGVPGAYCPNKKTGRGKEIIKFINELPAITMWDMHRVFKYKSDGFSHPGIKYGLNDVILVEFGPKERKVKPLPGMVEIKTSEYYKLQGE